MLLPDTAAIPGFIQSLIGIAPTDPIAKAKPADPHTVSVTVVDDADANGLEQSNAAALRALGFTVSVPPATSDVLAKTTITYPPGSESAAKAVAAAVPGALLVSSKTARGVTLALGNNGIQVKSLMSASPPKPAAAGRLVGHHRGPGRLRQLTAQQRHPAQITRGPARSIRSAGHRVELAGVERPPVQAAVVADVRAGQADRHRTGQRAGQPGDTRSGSRTVGFWPASMASRSRTQRRRSPRRSDRRSHRRQRCRPAGCGRPGRRLRNWRCSGWGCSRTSQV